MHSNPPAMVQMRLQPARAVDVQRICPVVLDTTALAGFKPVFIVVYIAQ